MTEKIEHLKMIQGIVNRLANSSFLLKGWNVVIVSALFALASKDHPILVWLALFPAISFWILDGYFLWQERLFRKLYDMVRLQDGDKTDFSMNIQPVMNQVDPWRKVTLSKTLCIYHGAIVLTILLVSLVSLFV